MNNISPNTQQEKNPVQLAPGQLAYDLPVSSWDNGHIEASPLIDAMYKLSKLRGIESARVVLTMK